ncbi:MAG: hypothetical protein IZT58_11215 [Actinobacteria bacterium]|nr:hypothetical protein [Actinomycetota bacterium]
MTNKFTLSPENPTVTTPQLLVIASSPGAEVGVVVAPAEALVDVVVVAG